MDTIPFTDFFAPIPALPTFDEALRMQPSSSLTIPQFLSPKHLKIDQLSQLDRADFFTYVIMGLATLIAIVIPLLNLS